MKIALKNLAVVAAMTLLAAHTGARAQAGLIMTVDGAGVQSSAVPGVITETFDSFSPGQYSSLATNVGTLSSSGEFSIVAADSYGGAGGTGYYFAVGSQSASADPVTLTLSGPQSYFGMWWSAADSNNSIQFYSGNTLLASYGTADVFTGLSPSYNGNPNDGSDAAEPFAYVNFSAMDGAAITSVVFSNNSTTGTGFEADNFSIATVPEPASLILSGTALAIGGLFLWRRRR